MPVIEPRVVTLPRLLKVEPGASRTIGRCLATVGLKSGNVVVVTGAVASRVYADRIAAQFRDQGVRVRVLGNVAGTAREAENLACDASDNAVDLLLAVGGGRVIDVAKLAARHAHLDVVTVPTSVANDGISSPVASLRDDAGFRQSYAAVMPTGVIVDTDIVATAPENTLLAGFGDLLSNVTAVLDWRLAGRCGADRFDEFSAAMAEHAALPALHASSPRAPETIAVLASGLVLSGLAMAIAGSSRPCSGAEHLISHSLDAILGPRSHLHGLQVALGTLVSAAAHGRYVDELHAAFRALGLPRNPGAVGLSWDDVCAGVIKAPDTRPGRYTILNEIDLDEISVRDLLDRAFD
ncbi:MAG: iron-containing alcohol dehydrogenase family protein [Euzebyaceae bacterium]|jgi:glycerol-1-phosphate dehydrogenase [NAD(P)+]|nr:iron-containing alcohol dehydrogenase family protein [Euzebyaceae bacterium]